MVGRIRLCWPVRFGRLQKINALSSQSRWFHTPCLVTSCAIASRAISTETECGTRAAPRPCRGLGCREPSPQAVLALRASIPAASAPGGAARFACQRQRAGLRLTVGLTDDLAGCRALLSRQDLSRHNRCVSPPFGRPTPLLFHGVLTRHSGAALLGGISPTRAARWPEGRGGCGLASCPGRGTRPRCLAFQGAK
jgi:hypothetical protein